MTALEAICQDLDAARPTAVNLHWALTQMMACARQHEADGAEAVTAVLEEKAIAIHEADVAINTAMARFGADELEKLGRPLTLLTHCNAGALATLASAPPWASSASSIAGAWCPWSMPMKRAPFCRAPA